MSSSRSNVSTDYSKSEQYGSIFQQLIIENFYQQMNFPKTTSQILINKFTYSLKAITKSINKQIVTNLGLINILLEIFKITIESVMIEVKRLPLDWQQGFCQQARILSGQMKKNLQFAGDLVNSSENDFPYYQKLLKEQMNKSSIEATIKLNKVVTQLQQHHQHQKNQLYEKLDKLKEESELMMIQLSKNKIQLQQLNQETVEVFKYSFRNQGHWKQIKSLIKKQNQQQKLQLVKKISELEQTLKHAQKQLEQCLKNAENDEECLLTNTQTITYLKLQNKKIIKEKQTLISQAERLKGKNKNLQERLIKLEKNLKQKQKVYNDQNIKNFNLYSKTLDKQNQTLKLQKQKNKFYIQLLQQNIEQLKIQKDQIQARATKQTIKNKKLAQYIVQLIQTKKQKTSQTNLSKITEDLYNLLHQRQILIKNFKQSKQIQQMKCEPKIRLQYKTFSTFIERQLKAMRKNFSKLKVLIIKTKNKKQDSLILFQNIQVVMQNLGQYLERLNLVQGIQEQIKQLD